MRCFHCLLWLVLLSTARAEFAIRDGDTVVFLGDSITANRQYGKIIETYTLLRFPGRKVRFINAGKGGETAKGSLERLDKDVFGQGATLVTVAYGVNDIGWGFKADEAHKREYLEAIGEIVERCRKHGVRPFICSAAITAEDPDKAEQGFLQKMCDEGLAAAKSRGAATIDVQRSMREVQRRMLAANAQEKDKTKPARMHVEDGVHLNELGQMAMAFAILKGLGAPAEVSAATIDARGAKVLGAESCQISRVRSQDGGISFTRKDDRLPLNLGLLWLIEGRFIPFTEELNRYLLTVTNLAEGNYEVLAGGRLLGKWDAKTLSMGINLASATADPWQPGGPWDAQGQNLKTLVDARDDLEFARHGMEQTLTAHPRLPALRGETTAVERSLIRLQRDLSQPVPVEFVVRPTRAPQHSDK
jgi:lysophospholipase L1-like esterase